MDTTTSVSNGKRYSWFYNIELYRIDSLIPEDIYLVENTPDNLKEKGFTEEEIKKPITFGEYYEKYNKRKFTKSFCRITEIEIITNRKEYEYLKKSFLGFGLKQKNQSFYNDYILIKCTIADISSSKLKMVQIELKNSFDKRTITLGNNLSMYVRGKIAQLMFN